MRIRQIPSRPHSGRIPVSEHGFLKDATSEEPSVPCETERGTELALGNVFLGKKKKKRSLKQFTHLVYGWSWERGDGVPWNNTRLNLFLMLVCIQTRALQRWELTARQFRGKNFKADAYFVSAIR